MLARRPGVDDRLKKTAPENPLMALTVIVEVAEAPAGTVIWTGLAVIVKSGGARLVTVTPTWTECVLLADVPVTATM